MSKTTKQVQEPSVVDPHNIMDTLCEGPVFLNFEGPFAMLVFTRRQTKDLGPSGRNRIVEDTVCARLTMTVQSLLSLRDMLNSIETGTHGGSGPSMVN